MNCNNDRLFKIPEIFIPWDNNCGSDNGLLGSFRSDYDFKNFIFLILFYKTVFIFALDHQLFPRDIVSKNGTC